MKKPSDVFQRLRQQQGNLGDWIEFTDPQGRPVRFPWLPVVAVLVILIFLVGIFDIFHLRPKPVSLEKVWEHAQNLSEESGLDARFLYALCWAESSFDAHARSSVARGIMQLTRPAWKEVRAGSYGKAFSWKKHIEAGVQYLLYCQEVLDSSYSQSYPHLAAAYRYGPFKVEAAGYDLNQLPAPENLVYRALFQGVLAPDSVPPPPDG